MIDIPSRMVHSPEELDAMPLLSVVLTGSGTDRPDVWQRLRSGHERTVRDWAQARNGEAVLNTRYLPALVLWTPEDEVKP